MKLAYLIRCLDVDTLEIALKKRPFTDGDLNDNACEALAFCLLETEKKNGGFCWGEVQFVRAVCEQTGGLVTAKEVIALARRKQRQMDREGFR